MKSVVTLLPRADTSERDGIEAQRAALASAEQSVADLRQRRSEILASATLDQIEALDAGIARASTEREIAAARLVPLEAEFERRCAAERLAVLERNLVEDNSLAAEERDLLDRYTGLAEEIVVIFREVEAVREKRQVLRSRLPPGVSPTVIERPRFGSGILGGTVLPSVAVTIDGGSEPMWPDRERRLNALKYSRMY